MIIQANASSTTSSPILATGEVSSTRYAGRVLELLPRGRAWSRDRDGLLAKLAEAISVEGGRVGARAVALSRETFPASAEDLLGRWERFVRPPGALPAPVETRRARLVAKLRSRGGQSQAFFRELAAGLGYDSVDFKRPPPAFRCGGEATCGDPLRGGDWLYVWIVETASGDDDDALEALIISQAHTYTIVLFEFN